MIEDKIKDKIKRINRLANCEIKKWYIRLKDGRYLLVYDKEKDD